MNIACIFEYMQKQHLLVTKVRLALPVMVLLFLLLTCLSSANHSFNLQTFEKFGSGKSVEQASGESVSKKHPYPLKVVAAPVNASGSGIVNEVVSLLAIPLLFFIGVFFFFRRLPESLFQKPVWRLPFLHIHRIFPNGP